MLCLYYIQIIERCISQGNANYVTNKTPNHSGSTHGSLSLSHDPPQGGLCFWWVGNIPPPVDCEGDPSHFVGLSSF